MASVREKIQKARTDLIEQGMRNSLVNFRLRKATGVEIINASPKEVYKTLVRENKTVSFAPDTNQDDEDGFIQSEYTDLFDDNGKSDTLLQTPYSSRQLQKRLLKTFYDARTHIEEQGVNVLFIALGMLKWFESEDSETERKAPLLLIPVELERNSVNSPFQMRYTGDGIGGNLSLKAKLYSDFRIDVPEPQLDENQDELDFNVSKYFEEYNQRIAAQPRWKIDPDTVVLSFFSYTKYLMYKDLDPDHWPAQALEEHPVLSKLLSESFSSQLSNQVETFTNHVIDEYLSVGKNSHILDADSSQAQAILLAKRGDNLVIQGPPGTGKSQTIANIIAEFVGDGKKVLFVAEKMAALEVVKRRLDDVSIGELCLPLHSNKANKRFFLDELQRTLNLGDIESGYINDDPSILQNVRDQLNAYASALNEPVGQTGVTPYQAYGHLLRIDSNLQGVSLPFWKSAQAENWTSSEYLERYRAVEELQRNLKNIGLPSMHAFWGSRLSIQTPRVKEEIFQASKRAFSGLMKLIQSATELAEYLSVPQPSTITETNVLAAFAEMFVDLALPVDIAWDSPKWLESKAQIVELLKNGRMYQQTKQKYENLLAPHAWEEDLGTLLTKLEALPSVLRGLNPGYRNAMATMNSLFVDQNALDTKKQIRIVREVQRVRTLAGEIERQDALGRELFKSNWSGTESEWDTLEEIGRIALKIQSAYVEKRVSQQHIRSISHLQDAESLATRARKLRASLDKYRYHLNAAFKAVGVKLEERYQNSVGLPHQPFDEQRRMLARWARHIDKVSDIVAYNQSRSKLEELGLQTLLSLVETWEGAPDYLLLLFERNRYERIIERAYKIHQELAQFNRESHERRVGEFKELDENIFQINQVTLLKRHFQKLSSVSLHSGQVGVLRHEFEKKRRHKPIRRLVQEAGQAIQAIKPVFMMSPLSVAAYLPPESISFDLVVFDEASQIQPSEALGAIARAKQVVVVGDSKQLPPTSFFDSYFENEDEDAFTSYTESILSLFKAQGAKEQMLRWHYRSRHESLIATSNHKFYDNRLLIFPSPVERSDKLGLKYRYLPNAYYEPGEGKSCNRQEARMVAEAVLEHARTSPELSLGVAAFSQSQAQAIIEELEIQRNQRTETEEFFNLHPSEPFFIKNLENVQGDERDVIFISIGYGLQANGKLSHNFGPLNKDGGERRLNVFITRARIRCEVFTNMRYFHINPDQTNSLGVKALHAYLKYAETGELDIPRPTGRGADSEFEQAVAQRLKDQGYEVHHQVGTAGYFIDLAIKDDKWPGQYLLGIECDGASYHSSASARERDRLRQYVLESKGWMIHRIWSTDWFHNQERAFARLQQAIEQAKMRRVDPEEVKKKQTSQARPTLINRDERSEFVIPSNGGLVSLPPYEHAPLQQFAYSDIDQVPFHIIHRLFNQLAKSEGPIHVDEAIKRVAGALGFLRITGKVKDRLRAAINTMSARGSLKVRNKFILHPGNKIIPRDRRVVEASLRRIEHIYDGEIRLVIMETARKTLGIQREELIQKTCYSLGISRVTKRTSEHITSLVDHMIYKGELRVENNHVFSGTSGNT